MSSKERKNSKLTEVSVALQGFFENSQSPLSQQFLRWKVWKSWESIVGKEIAAHSLPVGYQRGRLYIWVDSSVRMNEMTFLLDDLTEKINRFVGRSWIRGVQLTLDRKMVPTLEQADDHYKKIIK